MTIGDVLAVIGLLLLIVSSWGSMIVFATYLSPTRVTEARARIEQNPVRCGVIGASAILVAAIIIALKAGALVGFPRLFPFAVAGLMFLAGSVGSAGIVQILRERIAPTYDISTPSLIQTIRATTIYVLAGLFPVGGWFIVAPIALFVSIGAMFGMKRHPLTHSLPAVQAFAAERS